MPDQAAQGSELGTNEGLAESAGKHVQSFWKSLPGILTASGSFILALTGLISVLHQGGYVGAKSQVAQQALASAAPAPTAASSMISPVGPATVPADLPPNPLTRFQVGQMSDGFAMVRSRPTTASEGMVKLPSGTRVMCGEPLRDVDPTLPRRWRFCPEYDGYISARLLLVSE